MKLSTTTKQMLTAVMAAARVINTKNAMPICDCVKFWQTDNVWYVTGGNVETQVTVEAPIIESDGTEAFCVEATKLTQTLSALPDTPMTMDVKDGTLTIKAGKGRYKMHYDSDEDYPTIAPVSTEGSVRVTIPGSIFVASVKAAMPCCLSGEQASLKPQMAGVAIDCNDGSVTFVASDGRRMYNNTVKVENVIEGRTVIILPETVTGKVAGLFGSAAEVTVKTDGNRIVVYADGVEIISPAIEKKYPNYKSVLPDTAQSMTITLNNKDLMEALHRCQVYASDATHLVALKVAKNDTLEIETEDIDFSRSAVDEVGIVSTDVQRGFRIGANIVHLQNILKQISTENVIMKVTAPNRAIVFLEDSETSGQVEMMMPMLLMKA